MTIPLLPDDPHDEALRRLVKPPGWVNPTPAARYHLVVLGGGPAGLVCAAGAAGLGAKVALIERDLLGGDCLNVGCVPSKTLLRAAKSVAEIRRASEFGVRVAGPEIDFAAVMERVRRVRAGLAPVDSAERYRSLGVDVFLGEGRFVNEDTVEVAGAKMRFGRCVIATGSRAMIPDVPGLMDSRWFTNETIFATTELPDRLLVIGGGATGCELAQAFARLGSRVTLAARSGVLRNEDADAARIVETSLRCDGISIVRDTPDLSEFDAVLVAAGRLPNVAELNLSAAGVTFDAKTGIAVDDYLRTTNRRIFAAGDVVALPFMFTNAADAMARLIIRNALFPSKGRMSARVIPWTTYTDPELGHIGPIEARARELDRAVVVYRQDLVDVDRAATDGASGFVKVLARKDRIVGATVVGPVAGELIGTISVAMTNGVGLKKLANTVLAYPTLTESIRKVADQYNRTRLTSRTKWLIGKWLQWFR
jgi:pyruvate/2-oxoglutarate dehydrogenase complex dihydrolipoamide dehydrogenase (E3) component